MKLEGEATQLHGAAAFGGGVLASGRTARLALRRLTTSGELASGELASGEPLVRARPIGVCPPTTALRSGGGRAKLVPSESGFGTLFLRAPEPPDQSRVAERRPKPPPCRSPYRFPLWILRELLWASQREARYFGRCAISGAISRQGAARLVLGRRQARAQALAAAWPCAGPTCGSRARPSLVSRPRSGVLLPSNAPREIPPAASIGGGPATDTLQVHRAKQLPVENSPPDPPFRCRCPVRRAPKPW